MSGRDDVYEIEDLRELYRGLNDEGGRARVAVGVALVVIGMALAAALVPHFIGGFGGEPIDGGSTGPDPSGEGSQQRYQNYLTSLAFLFAPVLLPAIAVAAAFVGAGRMRGSTVERVATVTAGAAVGMFLGYSVFVGVGHLAYGEASGGFVVDEYPPTLRFGTILTNAFLLAVAAGVGSGLAGFGAALLDDSGSAPEPAASDASGAVRADGELAEGSAGADADATANADADDATEEASGDDSAGPERLGASEPASDYRQTGPPADSDAPRYDPGGRDWNGRERDRDED